MTSERNDVIQATHSIKSRLLRRSASYLQALTACILAVCCMAAPAQQSGTPFAGGSSGAATTSAPAQSSSPATSNTSPVASPALPFANQTLLYPGEDFRIGVGDLLAVGVYLAPDFQRTVRVGLDGSVQLPLIGFFHVQGLSVHEAQIAIADKLRTAEIYANPDVLIQVLDTVNGTATLTGDLKATIPVTSQRTLRDVLLAAGGLPPSSSHTIKIVRPGLPEPIVVNLGTDVASSPAADIPILPHDIIQISRAGQVYVIGAFLRQGAIPLDQAMPLTLIQLAALSGGLGYEGRYNDLRLIRTVGNERKLVQVDIKKVLHGKVPDPVLEANDIVFLPTNNMKAALKSLGIGGVLGLVSVLYSFKNF